MVWGLIRRGPAADYSPGPAYSSIALASVTHLRANQADLTSPRGVADGAVRRPAADIAQDAVEHLFTAALDLRRLVTAASSEPVARRLPEAIELLDAVINRVFAAALDHEQAIEVPRSCAPQNGEFGSDAG